MAQFLVFFRIILFAYLQRSVTEFRFVPIADARRLTCIRCTGYRNR